MVKTIQKKIQPSKPQLVTDILKNIYQVLDKVAAQRSDHMGTTCKKGCASCCYLFTTMSLPEGLLTAEHLLQSGKWEAILPALQQACIDNSISGVNKSEYFKKKLPCVFLDKDNSCSIYEQRPACCRLHYVISPPENCSPDAPEGTITKNIDLLDVEAMVWDLGAHVAKMNDFGFAGSNFFFAPIPVMVFFCMAMISKPEPDVREKILSYSKGVLPVDVWMSEIAPSMLVAEGDGIQHRKLVQIEKR